jgi:hypothetical protein
MCVLVGWKGKAISQEPVCFERTTRDRIKSLWFSSFVSPCNLLHTITPLSSRSTGGLRPSGRRPLTAAAIPRHALLFSIPTTYDDRLVPTVALSTKQLNFPVYENLKELSNKNRMHKRHNAPAVISILCIAR